MNTDGLHLAAERGLFAQHLGAALDQAQETPNAIALLLVEFVNIPAPAAFHHNLAHQLSQYLRDQDIVAHLQENTFACLLQDTGTQEEAALAAGSCAVRLAAQSRDALRALDGVPEPPALSIGIAISGRDATDGPTLLCAARRAQRKAREAGQLYCYHDPDRDEPLPHPKRS